MEYGTYEEGEIVEQQPQRKGGKQNNVLPFWGNESTMNLNPLILTNIQGSSYFKVNLFKLKTYHEVVDEIYYQVKHLEPWERGSRKTSGQTGMCGGVRGVGAGGIVSSAYCLLYKLYTLKLTRKQVNGLMNHADSCYIRGLGFMYIRYTQPPADLFDWYEPYLQDEEEIDVKAGGGQAMTIGQMLRLFLTKLEWFATLFPRIPVPIQKQIEKRLEEYAQEHGLNYNEGPAKREERFENGRDQERSRERRRDEKYGETSNKEREDDRRRTDDRYDRDRREKERYREKESKSHYAEERKYHSEEPRRDKYERPYRGEDKYDRSNRDDERYERSSKYERSTREEDKYERSYREDERYSKHSDEKRKHKKSKHKHHSRSRSRSYDKSDRKYR